LTIAVGRVAAHVPDAERELDVVRAGVVGQIAERGFDGAIEHHVRFLRGGLTELGPIELLGREHGVPPFLLLLS